jgi:hypothetical protein
MALHPSGNGVPARLETKYRVVDVDCENATISLENGQMIKGDVVIGANGVHVSQDFQIESINSTFTTLTILRCRTLGPKSRAYMPSYVVPGRVLSDF